VQANTLYVGNGVNVIDQLAQLGIAEQQRVAPRQNYLGNRSVSGDHLQRFAMACRFVVLVGKVPTKAVAAVHRAAWGSNHQNPALVFLYQRGRAFKPKQRVILTQGVGDKTRTVLALL
jgi:hypothetical protein